MSTSERPIEHEVYDAASLMKQHPPVLDDVNKRVVFDVACPAGSLSGGTVSYSRWQAMPLPVSLPSAPGCVIEVCPDVYDYKPVGADAAGNWHVNFADPHLFIAYGSGLFAQDEMQVAEHPVLGSLREALLSAGRAALVVEASAPTPILIRGVERRVAMATEPNVAEGRPAGLYGNHFAAASTEAIRRATRRVDPPTISNLLAIAAPSGGQGAYKRAVIEHIVTTAYTGFRAAKVDTLNVLGSKAKVVIHSGYWGCGVFGGNRVLMSLLQIMAAQLAGIDMLVFHTVDRAGTTAVGRAQSICADTLRLGRREEDVAELLDIVLGLRLRWGVSDSN